MKEISHSNNKSDRPCLLTIVALSYNNLEFLRRFIANIRTLSFPFSFDLIFIDDGTQNALKIFEDQLQDLEGSGFRNLDILLKEANKGIVDSHVKALERVLTPFVKIISIDDLLVPGGIERSLDGFSEGINVIQFPYASLFTKDRRVQIRNFEEHTKFFDATAEEQHNILKNRFIPFFPACLFRTELLRQNELLSALNGLKQSYEWPTALQITKLGIKFHLVSTAVPLILYIRHSKSISNWLFTTDLYREERELISRRFAIADGIDRSSISFVERSIRKIKFLSSSSRISRKEMTIIESGKIERVKIFHS